jgi:hypothetical protein
MLYRKRESGEKESKRLKEGILLATECSIICKRGPVFRIIAANKCNIEV